MNKKVVMIHCLFFMFLAAVLALSADKQSENYGKHEKCIYIQPELVLIPGGEFIMGEKQKEPKEGDKKRYKNNPAHKVAVDSFYIDKYEVTNYQYFQFCKETGGKLPI